MSGPVAMRTFQPIPFALFPDHCCRHNPRRDGDNRIADQHHDRRQETSDGCHRRYIAITDGRHRHDRPIDTVRNIIELRTGLVPFYQYMIVPIEVTKIRTKKKNTNIFGALILSDFNSILPSFKKLNSLKTRKTRINRNARITSR